MYENIKKEVQKLICAPTTSKIYILPLQIRELMDNISIGHIMHAPLKHKIFHHKTVYLIQFEISI